MNERIKELGRRAMSDVMNGSDPYGDADRMYIPAEFMEKFAELIIRECADQCTTNGPFTAETVWGTQFRKKIMDNFGVNHQGMHQCVPQTARPSESELQTQRTIC